MRSIIDNHDSQLTLDEANQVFQDVYPQSNDMTKIKLKCWLYYCQSRAEGSKKAKPFNVYTKSVGQAHYIKMVKGYIIDVSDFGGIESALAIINKWYTTKQ